MSAQRDGLFKQCECPESQQRKCDHPFHVAGRWKGKRFAKSLDLYAKECGEPCPRTRTDAEALAARYVSWVQAGKPAPKTTSPESGNGASTLTFNQAWPLYVAAMLGHVETVADDESRFRVMARIDVPDSGLVGSTLLVHFTESIIQVLFTLTVKGKSNATKHKVRRNLRELFRWAAKTGHITTNPITEDTVLHCGKSNMRKERCKPEREARLLKAVDTLQSDTRWRMELLIVWAIDCSLRIGELLAIQWRDILWDEGPHGRVLIRAIERNARKNRKPRRVPLTPRVRKLLDARAAAWASTDYVCGDATGGKMFVIGKAWDMCVARAEGLTIGWTEKGNFDKTTRAAIRAINLHFHDLRREGALRWYHDKGYGLNTIATLLGHSNLETLKVYLGIDEDDALDEAERLANSGPTGPKPGHVAVQRQYGGRSGRVLPMQKKRQIAAGE